MVLSGYICLLDRMEQSNVTYNIIFIFYGQAKVSIALLCTCQYLSLTVTPSLFKPIFLISLNVDPDRIVTISLLTNGMPLVKYFILLLKLPKFIQPTITLLVTSRGDQFDLLKTFHDMVFTCVFPSFYSFRHIYFIIKYNICIAYHMQHMSSMLFKCSLKPLNRIKHP